MAKTREEMSLEELFSRLVRETSTLVRQEIQLATVELRLSAEAIGRGIAFLVVGGAVAYAAFLALLAAIILALGAAGMAWWLAALIVGVVVAVVAYVLITRALDTLNSAKLMPQQTIATLEEDEAWLKEQIG